jgi:hypothetical protein
LTNIFTMIALSKYITNLWNRGLRG